MRSRSFFLVAFILVLSASATAQQQPQRDPQAMVILQQALAAMGGVTPSDSVATGTVVIVAGSATEQGTIRILTRGLDQSAELIQTTTGSRAVIYSRDLASETQGTSVKSLQQELVMTSQCAAFPLPLLAGAMSNTDTAFQYLGLETLGGLPAHHIRFWNTFSSKPKGKHLVSFSIKDLWTDAVTGIPRKLSYVRRAARGSEPGLLIEVFYSDYRSVRGVLYPFRIEKSLNGTPWATISIQQPVFNNGLTDADFPVQ